MMDHKDAISDIANAIMRLRAAFMKHHMNPPTMIVLADVSDADRLRALPIHHMDMRFTDPEPVEAVELPVQMKVELCGMQIRYPARKLAERGGGWKYV